ncbi:hypothetical protein Back2_00520 [Nocardioides baekrokdamisoli]|uniref:Rhodanese domain-containing protein n=1 Tax=Nocardioides baekrokdamisoli TaxID=1804624 RepID=A0A3G9IIC0_9ACTN|nr:hypothetical protein [Nocardioides baekrokdamisoli]BBH15765.1 hypothetical protein Back2_00520 [Nocardioides baekrokdamisoli]
MGKASKRKFDRRQGTRGLTDKEKLRHTKKIDARGQRVPQTIVGYERVAKLGKKRLEEALIARHTARMGRIRRPSPIEQEFLLGALVPIVHLTPTLLSAGASSTRPPCSYYGEWPDHLLWGVDSAVATTRLLMCGQIVGAATVARNQLERWLMHRAHNASMSQNEGESTLDFIARVWSSTETFHEDWSTPVDVEPLSEGGTSGEEPKFDHEHVQTTDGREICPPLTYKILSELMHARWDPNALGWDALGMLEGHAWPDSLHVAVEAVTDAITLCLRQVRTGAAAMALARGDLNDVALLKGSLDWYSSADFDTTKHRLRVTKAMLRDLGYQTDDANAQKERDEQAFETVDDRNPPALLEKRTVSEESTRKLAYPPLSVLAPLVPMEGLSAEAIASADTLADLYEATVRGRKPAGRMWRDNEYLTIAFGWHRSRSISTALDAMEYERSVIGEGFSELNFGGRIAQWILLGEATSLVGAWHENVPSSAAASLLGSGVRSAYWLWLEDDDRAMSVLRCLLEQTARLRVWRLKPEKAARLEEREQTTPRDWLEDAGWRRLRPLNTALGEYAHTKASSRWSSARQLLSSLQVDADPETAISTARGAAIDFVCELIAAEIAEQMESISPTIAEVLKDVLSDVGLDSVTSAKPVEQRLNHIWSQRATRLGDGDFTRVARPETAKAQTPQEELRRRLEQHRGRPRGETWHPRRRRNPFL